MSSADSIVVAYHEIRCTQCLITFLSSVIRERNLIHIIYVSVVCTTQHSTPRMAVDKLNAIRATGKTGTPSDYQGGQYLPYIGCLPGYLGR